MIDTFTIKQKLLINIANLFGFTTLVIVNKYNKTEFCFKKGELEVGYNGVVQFGNLKNVESEDVFNAEQLSRLIKIVQNTFEDTP